MTTPTGGMTARTYATGGQYEADGGLKEITIGALKETRTYNGSRQVESIGLAKGTTGVWNLTNYYCGFDSNVLDCAANNGNVMKQVLQQPKPPTEGGGSQQFQIRYLYDAVNRLTSAQEELATNPAVSAWGQTFGYDQYGNRWVTGMIPDMPTGTPNGPQWVNAKNQLAGIGTQYDPAGNLTLLGTGSHAFQWDVEGRKVEDAIVTAGSTYRTWYAYDADGRRVRKQKSNGTWTVFVYDAGGKVVAEYESGDTPTTELNYVYQDHLGSTRLVADTGGVPRKRYDYMPFGEEVGLWNGRSGIEYGGTGGMAQRFTGKERDAETGLDYFGARYMSAAQGRFASIDPVLVTPARMIDPQRFNLYAYARNSPFTYIDPDGEDIQFANDSEEGRKKALALITKNLNPNEAKSIGIRSLKGGGHEAYVIDPNAVGKGASAGYTQLTGLIGDKSIVAEVGLIGGGLTSTFRGGQLSGFGTIKSWDSGDSNAGVSLEIGSKCVNVLVTRGDGTPTQQCCREGKPYQGQQPDYITMWHELVGETLKYRAGHADLRRDAGLDNPAIIKIENEIRQFHGMNPRTGADHGMTVITVKEGNKK